MKPRAMRKALTTPWTVVVVVTMPEGSARWSFPFGSEADARAYYLDAAAATARACQCPTRVALVAPWRGEVSASEATPVGGAR